MDGDDSDERSEELILHHIVLEDLLQWKWFSKTCVCVCYCHRNASPAPFCLLNHSWIYLQWLFLSITVWTRSLLLACDKLHSFVTLWFLGGPRKTLPISEQLYDSPFKVSFYLYTEMCEWSGRQTAKLLGILGTGFCSLIYNFFSTGSDT